jgi:glycosyltransferase involved in cell wall biosynthesis
MTADTSSARVNGVVPDPSNTRLLRLLYMSEHPPSQAGGAPLIARQHLRRYDRSALHVLCDRRLYQATAGWSSTSLLPCPHDTVVNLERGTMRPRRFFGPAFDIANLARIPLIVRKAKQIIRREGIEAILTVPWRTDFAAAAYLVSRELDIPLYVFEMDDWHALNKGPIVSRLTRHWQPALLKHARHVWVISPRMAERYRSDFGIEGEFLFHFVEPSVYRDAAPREPPDPGELRLVYTGAVNTMFLGALERLSVWLNDGVTVLDRRVVLDIWGPSCPPHLHGGGVRWRGFVPSDEVPGVLAGADALLIAITFSSEPALRSLVKSSVYTKTIDYLASQKPIVLVSPADTAEVDYVGDVTWLVDTLERERFVAALLDATTSSEARQRAEAGFALVQDHHTPETMGDRFLSRLRAPIADGAA